MRKLMTLLILAICQPYCPAQEKNTDKKIEYSSEQLRTEEAKFSKVVRGPVNAMMTLYAKNPELWYMDPLVRDRWMKNIEELIIDGFFATRKAKLSIEIGNSERAGEYINQLRFANQGILKNIAAMKIPLAPKVGRTLGTCRTEEVDDPNGLFLNLDQAESRLQRLMELRVSLIEHLFVAAPILFENCPAPGDIIDSCCDLYIEPKVKCFAELKELAVRTDMSYKNRCDAVARVIGYHNVASDQIETKIGQLENALPLAVRLEQLIKDAERKKK